MFAPPQQPDPSQKTDPFFSTMAKRGMDRKRPPQRPQMGGQGQQPGPRQPPQQQPQMSGPRQPMPGQLPPPPPAGYNGPPGAPAGPPPGSMPGTGGPLMAPPQLPRTGGPLMAPPQTGGPLMAPQATASSADVNLGPGFDPMRAQQRRQASAIYGPGASKSFLA